MELPKQLHCGAFFSSRIAWRISRNKFIGFPADFGGFFSFSASFLFFFRPDCKRYRQNGLSSCSIKLF
nr:hypothetical protein [uncultured Dysosmobacter sp.]